MPVLFKLRLPNFSSAKFSRMNQPPYSDPNQPQQPYYDPNQYPGAPVGGQPPQGYTRVQAPKKSNAGDKYKGSGKKGKRPKDPRAPNMWANMGVWVVGLGLPIMLIYFAIQKLFVEKIEVQYDPYPAVLFDKEKEKELLKLGQDVATELREGHKDELQRRVVWDEVIYRVSRNMQLTLSQSTKVRDEIKAHWPSDIPGLFRQILGSELDRIPTQFVKLRQRDGYPCVLLRTMGKEGRVYYYDLLVVPVKAQIADGVFDEEKLRIVDIWDCQRGMFASDQVRREVLLEMPTNDDASRPWKAIWGDQLTKEDILAIKTMLLTDSLNKTSTIQDLKELPDYVRNSPQGYDIAIHAYQKLMDGIINPTQLEAFKARLGNLPTLDPALGENLLVSGTMLAEIETKLENKEEIEKAWLQAYKQIGQDPYLKVIVGKLRLAAGDVPGAEAMAAEVQKENRQLSELQDLKNALEAKRK
jgi:hypothetical protein